MNRLEYNERIYNYKHGLVGSAENQTKEVVEHKETNGEEIGASQNEEHIEHADGWEWQEHEYIDKIPLGNGKYRYVYPDGSMVVGGPSTVNVAKAQYAREQATNKGIAATQTQMGQQNVKGPLKTMGTPGSYTGNRDSGKLALAGTPGGIHGPSLTNNFTVNQGKGPLETMGTPGSYTGNRDTAKWAGKGTPGGTNGPSLTKGQHAAEAWNNFKNFVQEGSPLNKANEFYKEAPNYNSYDLVAIEQANPQMRGWTHMAMGLAHGLLHDYLAATYPEYYDEEGHSKISTSMYSDIYQNDANFRDLANRVFVEAINMPDEIVGSDKYYTTLIDSAKKGYTYPEVPQKQETVKEEPKATIQDVGNFITNDGQIQPAEETKTSEEAPKNTIADFAMQIGANGPQEDLYDVYTKNSDPKRRELANYAMGYALGYLYGNIENVNRAFPDWVGANGAIKLDVNDQETFNDFCAYAYNHDPELKEIADAIYAGLYGNTKKA